MREWMDPRDGMLWAVDALPFDVGPAPTEDLRLVSGWTLVFVSHHEHRVLPVGYLLGVELATLADRKLMALLDAARVKPGVR